MKSQASSAVAFFLGASMSLFSVFHANGTGLTPEQKSILNLLSIEQIDNCRGGESYKTLRVTGVNLQIVNGVGNTSTTNGTGNLIVGYNEDLQDACRRNGSHNIVVGRDVEYTQYGSVAAGETIGMHAPYSAILGGHNATADNDAKYSVLLSGINNIVSGKHSVVLGGESNRVDGDFGTIVSGFNNRSSSKFGVILNGEGNRTHGEYSSILNGILNVTNPDRSYNTIGTGLQNVSDGFGTFIGSGWNNNASGFLSFIATGGGSQAQEGNTTTGEFSVVLGGWGNMANGWHSTVVNGIRNVTGGRSSTIVGGESNSTLQNSVYGVISGGHSRSTAGVHDWTAGSLFQDD